jgi:CheY-like chemotaxis protein
MTMPQMTGDALAREILTIRYDIPIILCTGFSEKIDKKMAEEIGIKSFLMKPIVKGEIANIVRQILDGK